MKKTVVFLISICLFSTLSFSSDPIDILEELVSHEKSPRPLSSEDVGLFSNTPLPLQPLMNDFNGDKIADHVISGVYNLPGAGSRFFLLIGSERSSSQKAKTLYFREYSKPVFLHAKGTTGEADPGDQSFSISFCLDCDQGFDFYWDKHKNGFLQKAWSARFQKVTKVVEEKAIQVPTEKVDEALKLVGVLPDVQMFVKKSEDRKETFKTRVEAIPVFPKMNRVLVKIIEVKNGSEKQWDQITVDLEKKEILDRKRKVKAKVRGRF